MEPNIDLKSQVTKRLRADKRWAEAEPIRDRLMREARETGLSKEAAQVSIYQQLDAMFPPIVQETTETPETTIEESNNDNQVLNRTSEGDVVNHEDQRDEREAAAVVESPARPRSSDSTVDGLGKIPASWPQLPSNATLSQEVQWVLANRIQVIKETNDGIVVDLSKALSPAPSYATLGWLETSIRAFAKFVDVSTKASANSQDDADKVKREKLEIAEIRELLGQMRDLVASK